MFEELIEKIDELQKKEKKIAEELVNKYSRKELRDVLDDIWTIVGMLIIARGGGDGSE